MAKQIAGLCFFEGTFDDLVFYKMDNQYYVRVKSSLSSKRVKTSPEFKWTMFYATLMARASRIGSVIYKSLPPRWRQFWMYRSFTGEALTLLKENAYTDEQVKAILWERYVAYWEARRAADPDELIWQPIPPKIRKRRKYSEETIQRWIASGKLRDPAAEEKKRVELEKKRARVRERLEREARAAEAATADMAMQTGGSNAAISTEAMAVETASCFDCQSAGALTGLPPVAVAAAKLPANVFVPGQKIASKSNWHVGPEGILFKLGNHGAAFHTLILNGHPELCLHRQCIGPVYPNSS